MCAGIVSLFFPFISCSCLSPRKTTTGVRGFGYVRVPLCVCTSADATSPTQANPQNTVGVFPRKLGGYLGLLAASYGAIAGPKIWQDPGVEGRQEPAAEERQGKLFKLWPEPCCLNICSSVLSNHLEPHSRENCAQNMTDESSFAFLMWSVLLFLWLLLKALFEEL